MSIFLSILLAIICGAWLWQRRNYLRHLRHAEEIIDAVAAGQRPASFVFHKTRDFSGLAWRLEHLSDEHELLKKQVEERKFNLDAILASMIEGVLVVSEKHVIRMVNDSFAKMFNVSADPGGQTILRATREAVIDEIVREALSQGAVESREITVNSPQSQTRHFSVNAVPLKNVAGGVTGVLAVFHDVSRLRQLEEVRREFVANVSHELRTPLSIFHGYLENLLETPEIARGELEEILRIMRKHSHRLNALLEDLLVLARLESRRVALELADVPLEPFISGLAREWSQKFTAKNIRFVSEIAKALSLRADVFRLEQVLSNLLDNALKFSREGGQITIRAMCRKNVFELRVEDQGIGIPPADLPHVFERFYRVEKARSRDSGGTGLGLSIVKHIVGLHGGSVHAESTFGQGTAIVLSFPIEHQ